jgi:pimeloyl-ACP methyl ester carboxylesterase
VLACLAVTQMFTRPETYSELDDDPGVTIEYVASILLERPSPDPVREAAEPSTMSAAIQRTFDRTRGLTLQMGISGRRREDQATTALDAITAAVEVHDALSRWPGYAQQARALLVGLAREVETAEFLGRELGFDLAQAVQLEDAAGRITATGQASALHQVIGQLRASGFDGDGFGRVLVAGHSLGTGVAILEAATYDDADGLVLTGLGHRLNAVGFSRLFLTQLHPALLDPAFVGTTLDPGYVTTKPGVRGEAFHAPAAVDPAVIAHDEATKNVFSLTEAPDLVAFSVLLGYSNRITAPVLLLLGGQDSLNCASGASDCSSSASLQAQEAPYYVGARCFDARVLPGIGHALNLHPSAPSVQTTVADWADAAAGSGCPAGS